MELTRFSVFADVYLLKTPKHSDERGFLPKHSERAGSIT